MGQNTGPLKVCIVTCRGARQVLIYAPMHCAATLTKLSCLLAPHDADIIEVRKEMSCSTRGEITEEKELPFFNPGMSFPSPPLFVPPLLLPPVVTNPKQNQKALGTLAEAIKVGDQERVDKIVTQAKAEGSGWVLSQYGSAGHTLLYIAATSPSLDILRDFLESGASVHVRNRDGRTAPYLAADAGMLERVELLRKYGAHLHVEEVGIAKLAKEELEKGNGRIQCVEREVGRVGGTEEGRLWGPRSWQLWSWIRVWVSVMWMRQGKGI